MAVDKAAERRMRRARRHARITSKIRGTRERPRLVVSRSLRNIEGQIVDDDRGVTLTGYSTQAGDHDSLEAPEGLDGKVAESWKAGKKLAERALEKDIEKVVFDRAGYPYHGRIEAFADGARAGGLDL